MKKICLLKQWFLFASFVMATGIQAQTVVVLDCNNLNGWQEYTESTASIRYVTGPGTPPLSSGSIEFSTGSDGLSLGYVGTEQYKGTLLSDLTELNYWTYVQNYLNGQAPAIEIFVDNTGDGTIDDRLVFEPIYQRGGPYSPVQNGGKVLLNTWQQWDALIGGWWTAHDGTAGPPTTNLETYTDAHPEATIVKIILTTGDGHTWPNFLGNADALSIGVNGVTTTYDFEPCETDKKVTICHKGHTISVAASAVKAHLAHGDQMGACGAVTQAGNAGVVEEEVRIPAGYGLNNYPNPFTSATRIQYSTPFAGKLSLKVYDAVGREVSTLFDGVIKAGYYSLDFNAAHLSRGTYFYVLRAASPKGIYTQTKTMILEK